MPHRRSAASKKRSRGAKNSSERPPATQESRPYSGNFNADDEDILSLDGSPISDLVSAVASLQELVSTLSKQIVDLRAEVATLRQENASPQATVTYAEAVKRKLSPRQLEQVSLIRKVMQEEKRSDDRDRNLIVKEIDEQWKCKEAMMKLCEKANVQPFTINRLGVGKLRRLVRITYYSREDVDKFRKVYVEENKDRKLPVTIRVDLSESELQIFRIKWKEAIRRNDEARKKIWGVRNLELVRLKEPGEWQVRSPHKTKKDGAPSSTPSCPVPPFLTPPASSQTNRSPSHPASTFSLPS